MYLKMLLIINTILSADNYAETAKVIMITVIVANLNCSRLLFFNAEMTSSGAVTITTTVTVTPTVKVSPSPPTPGMNQKHKK